MTTKILHVCQYLALILLFSGCSQSFFNEEAHFEFQQQFMSDYSLGQISVAAAPVASQIEGIVNIEITNLSQNEIRIEPITQVKLFVLIQGRWQAIENRATYGFSNGEAIVLRPKSSPTFSSIMLPLYPEIDWGSGFEKPAIRILVIGRAEEPAGFSYFVADYLDVDLNSFGSLP